MKWELQDFQKIRDQAEEKVSIADAMYSLVEKYHNRLTREVMHFKYELEADSPGITETIERSKSFIFFGLVLYRHFN